MRFYYLFAAVLIYFTNTTLPQISAQTDLIGPDGELATVGQGDSAYVIYKTGYLLVLNEKWEEAGRMLDEVILKYPASEYTEDARYWTAYVLKHQKNRSKDAVAAYSKFVRSYPKSKYYDDALADLAELSGERSTYIDRLMTPFVRINKGSIIDLDTNDIIITNEGKRYKYNYAFSPRVKMFKRSLRLHFKKNDRILKFYRDQIDNNILSPELQLRMDALEALSSGREDEKSYNVLKDIALDLAQPYQLRETALIVLADYRKFNVLPIFIDVLKMDTSENIQIYAIDYISGNERKEKKAVSVLIDLFNALPEQLKEKRQMIFYSIADIGTDRAVDFLAKVARTSKDDEMRRDAVYFLSSIGSEKSREALNKILKGD